MSTRSRGTRADAFAPTGVEIGVDVTDESGLRYHPLKTRARGLPLVLGVCLGVWIAMLVVGCGGRSSSPTTTSAHPPTAKWHTVEGVRRAFVLAGIPLATSSASTLQIPPFAYALRSRVRSVAPDTVLQPQSRLPRGDFLLIAVGKRNLGHVRSEAHGDKVDLSTGKIVARRGSFIENGNLVIIYHLGPALSMRLVSAVSLLQ